LRDPLGQSKEVGPDKHACCWSEFHELEKRALP
jgi:hypothetical protein